MAYDTSVFVLLILLSSFVIALSSMILAYVGGIAAVGSDEMKKYKVMLRKWLIGFASVLLILAVATFIVGIVMYMKPAPEMSLQQMASRF